MNIGERLRLLRGKLELSQAEASVKFGIPSGSWKKYETGPSEPGSGALRALSEGGVNVNWLLTGEGEMLLADQVGNVDGTPPCQIDTKEFVKILERLEADDFEGRGLGKTYIGYFAALIYNRVISHSTDIGDLVLEGAVHELNLILLDGHIENMEKSMELANEGKMNIPDELAAIYHKQIEEYSERLRQSRGTLRGRMLAPGTKFESEFIKGLGL